MDRRPNYCGRLLSAVVLVAFGSNASTNVCLAAVSQETETATESNLNSAEPVLKTPNESVLLATPFEFPLLNDNPSEPLDTQILEANYQKPAASKSSPTYPNVQLHGFFQADTGWFGQDAVNKASLAAINGVPNGDLQDGADFRRARLSAGGDVAENIGYFMEYDFAFPGRPSFMDNIVDLRSFVGDSTFRLGYWRQPFSMDALTSVKDLTFFERALPFTFVPFRQAGIGIYDGTEKGDYTWALSAIRFPTDFYGGNVGDNGGYGTVGRLTAVPWADDDDQRLLHVGGAYTFADPASDIIRYRAFPEFAVVENNLPADIVPPGVPNLTLPFADTGNISAQNVQLFGGELALVYRSLYIQSEAIYSHVDQIAGPTVDFWGAYARAGYFLTGEVRPYNRKAGVLGTVTPLCPFGTCTGSGAWELAAQWSAIDLNDQNIAGGRMNNVTAGLNWYLNKNFKFQFGHIHVFLNSPGFGDSDADITAARAQVVF
ncbi:OprO/OprP family phosphate-selective porin [Bythopirellula polymerisocia]|nr:porin [Bythopirellula polymerisocia]